ncbi:20253_t:CDS:1, partial [Rhizophagus irregularis]
MVYEINVKNKHESAPESDNGKERSKDSALNSDKSSNDQKVTSEIENQIVNRKDNTNSDGSTLSENDIGENNQVKQISLKESDGKTKNVEIRKDLREFSDRDDLNRFKHPLLQRSEENWKRNEIVDKRKSLPDHVGMFPIEHKNESKSQTSNYEENFHNQWHKSNLFNKGGLTDFDDKRKTYTNLKNLTSSYGFERRSMKSDFDSKPDHDTRSQVKLHSIDGKYNDAFPPLKRDHINEPRNESTNFQNKHRQNTSMSDSTHSANTSEPLTDNNNQDQKSNLGSQSSSGYMNAWFPNVINRWMPV